MATTLTTEFMYLLWKSLITGVCNLTRQGRLQKTTTTITRNSTVCLCIFFHVPHFYSAFYPTFRSTFPQAEFRILHVRDFPQSAFRILPVPRHGQFHTVGVAMDALL